MDAPNSHNGLDPSSLTDAKPGARERIFRLLQLLLANNCTRSDIFKHLSTYYNIHPDDPEQQKTTRRANKMFERDLRFLKSQGFEIKKVRTSLQSMRYHLVNGSNTTSPFLFSQQEIDTLALLYNLFADPTHYLPGQPSHPLPEQLPHHPFAEDVLTLIEKFVATLPAQQKKYFDRWVRKPYLYFNLTTVADYLPHRGTINTIIQAISLRQQIRFTYMPAQNQQETTTHEHIDPYYITYMDGHFYLIAYSHPAAKFLEYRIDRIQEEQLRIEPHMIDVERRRHPIEFSFWIDSRLARSGLSQRWLTQTIEREETYLDPQGKERRRLLVRATAYSEWRIIQQLLKYGEKAELVGPPHLREQMKQVAKQMYTLYE